MKRFRILLPLLLLGSLACGIISPAVPTLPSPITALPSSSPTAETSTPQVFAAESATPEPIPTFAAPQSTISHHPPGDSITLDQIKMIDASNGWAVSAGEVFFTIDGGNTWQEVTPPEVWPAGSQVQAQGMFLDARHAWIVFSVDQQISTETVVWHTDNGGRTWLAGAPLEHQAFGDQVWAQGFALDAQHLWLMVRGVYVGAGTHYDAQLFLSGDAGQTWLSLSGNEAFDYNYDYTGLVFADANHGLVTWQTTGAYAPGPPSYAVTFDGAGHWETRELPPPPDKPDLFESFDYCEPYQPRMLSGQSIRMLMGCFSGYEYSPPQTFSSYLYSSEDGGSTWTSVPLPEKVIANQDTLFFFDKDNALLLGRDIYRSTDGGQTWTYVKSVFWDGQFSFIDPQTGWAVARTNDQIALVRTSNGGAAWIEIKPVVGR